MDLDTALKSVAVIGAGGKMGSGIALLLLQEIARLEALQTANLAGGAYKLELMDMSRESLDHLKNYLRVHLKKYAEKNIIKLRSYFSKNPALVSNEEIVSYFVDKSLEIAHFGTDLSSCKNVNLIFEAILEDVEVKAHVLRSISTDSSGQSFYFTNTSSIPIQLLSEKSKIEKRLVGFHFYNPPPIQKLLEIIIPESIDPNLSEMAVELSKRLNKTLVYSNDRAGFIGNGHFIREMVFAFSLVHEKLKEFPLSNAIGMMNQVTKDFLVRPMGIFQLIDYIGIDVCQRIAQIMASCLSDDSLREPLLDRMVAEGVIGGQYSDGTQKDGFFKYVDSKMEGIYSLEDHRYIPIAKLDFKKLGPLPEGHISWKKIHEDPHSKEKLFHYFDHLFSSSSLGAKLAITYLEKSLKIAELLVDEKVARSLQDVETVLKLGFYHAYSPQIILQKENEGKIR